MSPEPCWICGPHAGFIVLVLLLNVTYALLGCACQACKMCKCKAFCADWTSPRRGWAREVWKSALEGAPRQIMASAMCGHLSCPARMPSPSTLATSSCAGMHSSRWIVTHGVVTSPARSATIVTGLGRGTCFLLDHPTSSCLCNIFVSFVSV